MKEWLSPKLKSQGSRQKDLAKHCGLCSQAITAYVTGRNDPSVVTLYKIADFVSSSKEQRDRYIVELVELIHNNR